MTDYPTPNTSGTRYGHPRLIVLHSTETPTGTAHAVARNFQNPENRASAHWIIGTDGTVSGVPESDVAWAAPGANHDGIQVEQCGHAYRTDWTTGDGLSVLTSTAEAIAGISQRWGIPLRHLSNAELAAGASGVVTHAQVSEVYRLSDHTDPGPTYPLSLLLSLAAGTTTTPTTTTPIGDPTMNLICTPLSDGTYSYALITETSGARTLDAQETGAYTRMLGEAPSLPWDWYWLVVRQAWERHNTLATLVGREVDEAADSIVERLRSGLAPKEATK